MISGFVMFLIGAATLIVFSYLYPDEESAERAALVWKSPLDPLRGKSWRFLGNYRVIAALLFLTMVGLYWQFSGTESYYPVQAKVMLADDTPVSRRRSRLRMRQSQVRLRPDDRPRRWFHLRLEDDGRRRRQRASTASRSFLPRRAPPPFPPNMAVSTLPGCNSSANHSGTGWSSDSSDCRRRGKAGCTGFLRVTKRNRGQA